nr:hypothetical protein [Tanacetum cinerariifolium]
ADSAVTYSSVHSEARSWSIPSKDPYEEATQQLFEQAPHSSDHRAGIPEADTLPRNRPLLATPRPGCEVGESSAATVRRPGPTMAHGKDRVAVRVEIELLRSKRLAYEQIMARTRKGQTPPLTNPNNPNNMTPEAVQTMIDQDLLRNSGGRDGSHSSH